MKEGDYQKAFFYTKRAANLPGSPLFYEQIPEINLGHIYYQMGDIAESIATYEAVIRKTLDKSPEAYEGLITCYLSLLEKSSDKEEKIKYFQSIQAHAERLFAMRPDPLIYYKLGKIALADKQPTEARKYFTLAASHMPENHELYPIVHKLLQH
jgi:tetratricopeptide (TPR) repeat protein